MPYQKRSGFFACSLLSCVITEPPPPSCMTANSTELLALSIAAATFFSEHRSPVLGLACGEKQRSNGGNPSRSVRGVQSAESLAFANSVAEVAAFFSPQTSSNTWA